MTDFSHPDDRLCALLRFADICAAFSRVLSDRLFALGSVKSDVGLVMVYAITRLTVIYARLIDYALRPSAFRARTATARSTATTSTGVRTQSPMTGIKDEFGILVMTRLLTARGTELIRRDQSVRFAPECQPTDEVFRELLGVTQEFHQWLQKTGIHLGALLVPGSDRMPINLTPP
ncbi:MAG: hypothetical protein AAGL18_01830 [Pseudomonadota bacterium]